MTMLLTFPRRSSRLLVWITRSSRVPLLSFELSFAEGLEDTFLDQLVGVV